MSRPSDNPSSPAANPNLSEPALLLLLEAGRERSVEGLVAKLMNSTFLTHDKTTARGEFWLIEKGDICPRCSRRAECPDQTRCLHLAGSRDNSLHDDPPKAFDSGRSEIRTPLGLGVVGKIASTAQEAVFNDLREAPAELFSIDWIKREKVLSFTGTPIAFNGEVLGVIAGFYRIRISADAPTFRHVFSDHIGGVIANARAFEEIQKLKAQLEIRNEFLQEEVVAAKAFGELVGQSPALQHIVNQIDLVAPTDASVLILGESGTGKELVAREIHRRSRRKDKPLVNVNCPSIPKGLFESEFFGHARGAFTGALTDRAGRFEAADGGTLFLDEIGEVPLDLQGKLLRVLQEKRYERVGEDRTRLADVRVIAATNRDLKREMAARHFREDLFYRINVFPIQVPPLRERMEDIPLLANHFIERSALGLGCARPKLTRAAVAKLHGYGWPGNIRELRNIIERAVIIARGGTLDFDLPKMESSPVPRMAGHRKYDAQPEFLTAVELRRRERENLLVILNKTNWKIKGSDGAAQLLGVPSSTLITRMKAIGLRRPD